jgi:K+-transporting ATPase KdpF subunit
MKTLLHHSAPDRLPDRRLTPWVRWSLRWGLAWLAALAAITPATAAISPAPLNSGQLGAIALLGLATIALSIYLFVAIFQPERF